MIGLDAIDQAAGLLGMQDWTEASFTALRVGARTRAILATNDGVSHCFDDRSPRVVVKLFKGANNTEGAKQYQHYHKLWFHQVPVLGRNPYVQQSIDAGYVDGIGTYAILQYIEGRELKTKLEAEDLSKHEAGAIIRDILEKIWVPLWDAGLRFKDCHPGNLVYMPGGRTVLIDTEQMRKDAEELLNSPIQWRQRDAHEKAQISRLPKLAQRIISATDANLPRNRILQAVKQAMLASNLGLKLIVLGREAGTKGSADDAVQRFLAKLIDEGLIA